MTLIFRGCVIVVSHDRYFMDKVVDHIFENKGEGIIKDFPGNYTQLREKQLDMEKQTSTLKSAKTSNSDFAADPVVKKVKKNGLTFKEKRELETLSEEIESMESEKATIETEMNTGILNSDELYAKSVRHGEIMKTLNEKELRWLELSEK
jgi:ATP-binding cassette subfamily F protein uup